MLAAQPLASSRTLASLTSCNKLGLSLVSATTAKRDVQKLYDSNIKRTIAAKPAQTMSPELVGMAFSPGFRRTFSVRGVVSTVPIPILTTLHTPHLAGLGRHPHSLRRRRGGKMGGTGWLILLWVRILRE